MLLFETPQDMLRAIGGGVEIKEANLGSMAHSVGKLLLPTRCMDEDDVRNMTIRECGTAFDVRRFLRSSAESFEAMLKKLSLSLARKYN